MVSSGCTQLTMNVLCKRRSSRIVTSDANRSKKVVHESEMLPVSMAAKAIVRTTIQAGHMDADALECEIFF